MDVGTQLRTSREARRLSLDALAKATRVQARVLAAIEQNDPSAIPPRPFGRGFVRAYAKEVGLDPDRTVHDYFHQFAHTFDPVAAAEPSGAPRIARVGWWRPIAAFAAVAVVIAGGVYLVRGIARPASDGAAIGTSGASAAPTPDTSHRAPAATHAAPAAEPPTRGLDVVITASETSWVTATADGQRVLYRLLAPGEKATIRATSALSFRTGNAGGITWTINGRSQDALGSSGAVKAVAIKLVDGKIRRVAADE